MSKIIIVGESGSGKDTVTELLLEHGYNVIISHTTRPRREGEGNTYIFSDKETWQKYNDNGLIFEYTIFGDNIYWTLKSDYTYAKWCIIVDPVGVIALKKTFIDAKVLYIKTDIELRRSRVNDESRIRRDINRFTSFPCDYIIENNGTHNELKQRLNDFLMYVI